MSRYHRIEDYKNRPDSFEKFLFFSGQAYLIGGPGYWTKSLEPDAGADYETVSLSEMSTSHLKNSLNYIKKDKKCVFGKYKNEIIQLMDNKIKELQEEIKIRGDLQS